MNRHGFFNLVLIFPFIFSSFGGITINQTPSVKADISWNVKGRIQQFLGRLDSWMDGIRTRPFDSAEITPIGISPTSTTTPGFGIAPTQEATLTVEPTATPTLAPTETITPTATPPPGGFPLASVEVNLDPEPAAPGDVVTATWTIRNYHGQFDGVEAWLYLPEAFTPLETGGGAFNPETNLLIVPINSATGLISWLIDGNAQPPFNILVEIRLNGQVMMSVTRSLGERGPDFVPTGGGEAHGFNHHVKAEFPSGALPEDAEVSVRAPENTELSLGGHPMELTAMGAESGEEITQFNQPVSITVQYTDEEAERLLKRAGMQDETSLSLFYYDETENTWIPLPTSVDPDANQFTAVTDHFSLFDFQAQNWEAARLPSLDGFQLSGFTGAGSYSYPIQVPPGPGGLQPSVALSYNTQEVDSASSRTQASWVGMGWSLDTGYIQRNMNGTPNYFGDDTFTLVMNGAGGLLLPIADQDGDGDCTNNGCTIDYRLANENYWQVRQYLESGDEGGYNGDRSQWVVFSPDGTKYYFGNYYDNTYGDIHGGHAWYVTCPNQYHPAYMQTWKWSLTRVRNIYEKELTYTYYNEGLTKDANGCSGYQHTMTMAVYPDSIIYPNNRYRIIFTRDLYQGAGTRTDFDKTWKDWLTTTTLFMQSNLKQIEVWHDPNRVWNSGDEVLIRKYALGYGGNGQQIFPGVTWPGWTGNNGKTLTLTSITEYGLNGTNSLPATNFTYYNMHFKAMENGYGGKLEYYGEVWRADEGFESYLYSPDVVYNITGEWYPDTDNENEMDDLKEYFQPGTYYKVSARVKQNAGNSVQLGINEGGTKDYGSVTNLNPGQWTTVTSYIRISGSASQARAFIQCNATCDLDWYEVYPLVTRYQISQKTITDQVTNSTYTTLYSYEGTAVNDSTHSDYVEADPSGTHLMTKPNSEYRGNSHVTETDLDVNGVTILKKVETWYSQDDIYKGQATKTQVKDAAGNTYKESDITYESAETDTANLPHPEDEPANSDLMIYWVYTTFEENRTYNGDTTYVATRNEYQYLTSDQGNVQYGNRTKSISYWWNGYEWWTYRGSLTKYFPNVTNGTPNTPENSRYLTGLSAYTNAYACNGSCDFNNNLTLLSAQKRLYDYNRDPNAQPINGVLTGERSLIFYATPPRTDARFADTEYDYDGWGNQDSLTIYTDPTDSSSFGQGTETQVTTSCYGTGTAPTCSEDNYGTYLAWQKNDLGQVTKFTYDKTKSVPQSITDPNNATTSATYDEFGRILTIVRPGDNTQYPTAKMSYHNASNPFNLNPFWTEAKQLITGSTYFVMRKYYSGIGQLLQTQVVGATIGMTTQDILTDTFYDAGGRVDQQTVPYAVTTGFYFHQQDSGQPSTRTTYDILGRTLTRTATDETQITQSYWDAYVNEVPYHFSRAYNAMGNGTTTRSDIWGRVSLVTPPSGPTISYTYDAADRLLTTVRGGATTTLGYDFGGRKTSMSDPDMGSWSYTYDALGNLKTQTNARSCMTTLSYDNLNRLTGKTYSGTGCSPTAAVTYTYDYGTNGIGRRTGMEDGSGSTSWIYDNRGRVTQETKTITSNNTFVTLWGYNSADLVTTMRYPANNSSGLGEIVSFTYLNQMLMDTVTGTSTYVNNTDYDAAGRVDVRDLGWNGSNPIIRVDYTYFLWTDANGQGRLKQIMSGIMTNTDSLQDLRYTYDANGNVLTIKDYLAGSPQTQTFTYDTLDRLSTAQASGGSYGTYSQQTYIYSSSTGNLTTRAGVNYTYDTNHKHAVATMGSDTYTYDADGNQVTRNVGGSSYWLTYDAENRLVGVTGAATATFLYDGDGNRVKGTVNGSTTSYIGNYFEWKTNTTDMKKYYYAGSTRVAMCTGTNPFTLNFLLGDHLGSNAITTSNSGVRSTEIRYMPWGTTRYTYGSSPTTMQYTGQRVESSLGLLFYNARWYDPSLARFIQADTDVPESQGIQALDRYAYAGNNPLRYTDPTGHNWWDTVGQFASGFVYEFARTTAWYSPQAQNVLSASGVESDAMLVGRIAADVATIIVGVGEVVGGITIGTGGTAVSCGVTLCIGAVATVGTSAVVTSAGVITAASGAVGLGNNLSLITSDDNSGSELGSPEDLWNNKRPLGGTVKNPDGTTTEYTVRQAPGRDGGWSRIVKIRDANGNIISVTHEAWSGTLDPRFDPPDHVDIKPVNKR